MRSCIYNAYGITEASTAYGDDTTDGKGLSLSMIGTGAGGGGEKKSRKKKEPEEPDSILTMVAHKEAELKEDPEFRFRRKPAPKKPVARNEGIFGAVVPVEEKKEMSEVDMRKAEKYLIKPHDENVQRWDMVGLVMIAYTAIVTPYDVSFLEPQYDVLFVFNRLVDSFFLCDMVLQFFLMVQDEKGRYIKKQSELAHRYLTGWFAIDFISVLPFDMVGLLVKSDDVSQLKVLRVIRVIRLFKLLRILRINRVFKRWENMYSINYSVFGLYCYIVFVFASTHWFGCFYRLVAFIEDDQNANWVLNTGFSENSDVYVWSIHWATQTISSIGYGDVGPQTTAERTFVTIFMFIGGVIFAFAIGEICGAVASLGSKEAAYHLMIDTFNTFADEVDLPNPLRIRVRQFFKHKYVNNTLKEQEVSEILHQLTSSLQMEVALYIHTDWIKEVPFFVGCDEEFVVKLAVSMKVRTFTPKEAIYSPGDEAEEMYVVKKGMCASCGVIFGTLKVFGIDMLHGMVQRPVTRTTGCRSIAFTDLYTLTYDGFQSSIKAFPAVVPQIRIVAIKIMMIGHILAFSKACMNFASGMTGFTADLLVLEMEQELENKKNKQLGKNKKSRYANVRDNYAVELRKMTKVLDNIKRTIHKLEKGKAIYEQYSK